MDPTPLPDLLNVDAQAPPRPIDFDTIHPGLDEIFKKYQRTHEFSGTVLVAEKGKVIHSGAYGYADTRRRRKLELGSVFQLASVSKTVTAAAVMILYEDGKLDFNDKIRKYIPKWPYKRMTIRHLLNHRSGLPRYDALSMDYWNRSRFMNYDDVLEMYLTQRPGLFFRSGTDFEYSNSNYAVLAAMVSLIAVQPFEQFVEERIFKPLGMTESYYCNHLDRLEKENHTIGYMRKKRRYVPAGGDHVDGVMGDKGLHSTVRDMYKFDQALYSNRFIRKNTLELAYTSGNPRRSKQHYGFGFRLKKHTPGLVYHFGWWRGYRTCFIRDTQAERTIIVLSNRDNPNRVINFWDVYYYLKRMDRAA